MKSVIFVCTGNICRSAVASAYMQKKVKDLKQEKEYIIDSCGTHANSGEKATQNAIQDMEQYGVDLTNHRAKDLNDIDITNYDLVLCMTSWHKQNLVKVHRKIKDNIFTLKEYIDKKLTYLDIDDPWGYNISVYHGINNEIVECVDKLIEKLKE